MSIPIFVVSLADSVERRRVISKRLDGLELDFEFVDAVDGRNGLPPDREAEVDREKAYERVRREMTDVEFGCALSHVRVYDTLLSRNIRSAIILEDDMIPTDTFRSLLQSNVLQSSVYDLVPLYYTQAQALKFSFRKCFQDLSFFSFACTPNSTGAYYITQRAAERLRRANTPVSYVADWPITIAMQLRCAGIFPSPIGVSGAVSLIEETRSVSRDAEAPASDKVPTSKLGLCVQKIREAGLVAGLIFAYHVFVLPTISVRVAGTESENASGLFANPDITRLRYLNPLPELQEADTCFGLLPRRLNEVWRALSIIFSAMRKLFLGQLLDPVEVFYVPELNLVIPINSKAACSSIKGMVLTKYGTEDPPGFPEIHEIDTATFTGNKVERVFFDIYDEYLDFVTGKNLLFIVREPCARFFSCYLGIVSEKNVMYQSVLGLDLAGSLRRLFQLPLAHLVKLVFFIPSQASDRHFRAQSFLYNEEIERRVAISHLFALENLSEQQETYPFSVFPPLGTANENPSDSQSKQRAQAQLRHSLLFRWKFKKDLRLYEEVRG